MRYRKCTSYLKHQHTDPSVPQQMSSLRLSSDQKRTPTSLAYAELTARALSSKYADDMTTRANPICYALHMQLKEPARSSMSDTISRDSVTLPSPHLDERLLQGSN